jgi:hypothetical protein
VHNDQQDFVHLEANLGRKDLELSKVMGVPQKWKNGWFMMENPIKIY